jgi:hypothetical protein
MTRDPLITEPVRQHQALLNMAKTMLGRNVVLGGFLERILLNAQLPGAWDGDTFVPDPLRVGAGTTNVLAGLPIYNERGEVSGYTSPSVVYRDPVPVTTFEATAMAAYRGILEETFQTHVLETVSSAASGESRKQARADFAASLGPTVAEAERAGRWLIETALAMAAAFSGQPGRYDGLRGVFACRVDTGPVSSDEQAQARENVKAGIMSEETAMARVGIDDVDAEKARIAAERAARQERAREVLGNAGQSAEEGQGRPPLGDRGAERQDGGAVEDEAQGAGGGARA